MKKLIVLLVALLAQVALVNAQLTIQPEAAPVTTGQLVSAVTGGDNLSVGPGTAGFSFTVGADPLVVSALGIFDLANDGLTASHKVGIWDVAGTPTLLTSVTIPTTGTVDINSFQYMAVTPITLQAGHSYVLAAQYADVDFDLAKGNASVTLNPGATYGHSVLSSGTGFDFPDISVPGADAGFFGPNISFAPVPEPAAWGILTAGALAAIAAIRRWKARQAAGAAAA